MKMLLAVTVFAALVGGPVFAQTGTGPAPQSDNMDKPGMSGDMSKDTKSKKASSKKMKSNTSKAIRKDETK